MREVYHHPAIAELLHQTITLWHESSSDFPDLGRRYTHDEQREREILFDDCYETVQAELRKTPRTKFERQRMEAVMASAFAQFAKSALELNDAEMDLLLNGGFSTVGENLARRARRLSPSVSIDDILQACRNAWTAGGLQLLLGNAMQLTPAIFAYSMIYPFTDNYLDDAAVSSDEKLAFSARFRLRLSGETLPPANPLEEVVWRLITLIEGQYSRTVYHQLYDSLLAIHRAQENSIRQLRWSKSVSEIDLLSLTFAKGGSSVLADAYLAAGSLTQAEAAFAFSWGVLLQLGDDLQDFEPDQRNGSLTLFSQTARREPLDRLTNRTFHFAERVMLLMDRLPGASGTLADLLRRSSQSLLTRSAGSLPELYSKSYLAALEHHSPLRFSFLNKRQRRIQSRGGLFTKMFEAVMSLEEEDTASDRAPVSTSKDTKPVPRWDEKAGFPSGTA
jgi:hypothetical protein